MGEKNIKFGITPCPNDTFSYRALMEGLIDSPFDFCFEDIETLNLCADEGKFPVTKLSFPAYMKNADKYRILNAGAALGLGTGPVLVKRGGELKKDSSVIVPGLNTTAALLLKFYARKRFGDSVRLRLVPKYFREIIGAVSSGEAEFGVLIHEGRFVFKDSSLALEEDLGEFWTKETKLPVPLGCICVRRDFEKSAEKVETLIRKSLDYAFLHEEETYPFVARYAQYLAPEVLKKHIYAFVNEYSRDMSGISDSLISNLKLGLK